jgi:hypothetical protein
MATPGCVSPVPAQDPKFAGTIDVVQQEVKE